MTYQRIMCLGAAMMVALPTVVSAGTGPSSLPSVLPGISYRLQRDALLSAGYQTQTIARHADHCFGFEDVCGAFPEASSCTMDEGRPCSFAWRTATGQRFYVETTGEAVSGLIVSGISDH